VREGWTKERSYKLQTTKDTFSTFWIPCNVDTQNTLMRSTQCFCSWTLFIYNFPYLYLLKSLRDPLKGYLSALWSLFGQSK
jgi:hypothetical protein